jgi:hypothetical protein
MLDDELRPTVYYAPKVQGGPTEWRAIRAFSKYLSDLVIDLTPTIHPIFVVPEAARPVDMSTDDLRALPRDVVDQWFATTSDLAARIAVAELRMQGRETTLLTSVQPLIESVRQVNTAAISERLIRGTTTFVVEWSTNELFDAGLNAVKLAKSLDGELVYLCPQEGTMGANLPLQDVLLLLHERGLPSAVVGAAEDWEVPLKFLSTRSALKQGVM